MNAELTLEQLHRTLLDAAFASTACSGACCYAGWLKDEHYAPGTQRVHGELLVLPERELGDPRPPAGEHAREHGARGRRVAAQAGVREADEGERRVVHDDPPRRHTCPCCGATQGSAIQRAAR